MADRFKAPTANLRDGAEDYSGKVNRAQGVAGKTGGSNYSGQYASTFSGVASVMKAIGTGGNVASAIGKSNATADYNKQQKSSYNKFNASAQKLGQAQQKSQGIKNEMATIKGSIDALNKVACEYADQLAKLESDLKSKQDESKKAEADKKSAQDKFNRAQQDFKNAMTPSSGGTSSSRKADAKNANSNMRDAQNAEVNADEQMTRAQNEANQIGEQKNSTLDQSNANLQNMADKYGDYGNAETQSDQNRAEQNKLMQEQGNTINEMRNNGLEYQNEMKTWGTVGYGSQQLQGWADSVDKFGQAKFYEGSASSINQTINTLRGLGDFGRVGDLVAPFLTESVTQLGQVMQRGGNAGDWGMAMGQATFGLGDWMTAYQAIENAVAYSNDGDDFTASMELNRAIPSMFDGFQRGLDTASIFTGTQNPFTNKAIDFLQSNVQTLHGEMVGSFELARAGADFGGQLALGATALPYSLAKGVGELFDGIGKGFGINLGISPKLSEIRNNLVSEWTGIPTTQMSPYLNAPEISFIPRPREIPDSTSLDALRDPLATNSRGGGTGKNCPPRKPPVSSIIADDPPP